MESLIVKCYGSLQEKLEKEKENLKSVEANIKKIIGRSVVDSGRQVRVGQKRNSSFIEPSVINSNAELWKSALEASGPNRKSFGGRTDFSGFERTERRHRVSDEFVPRDTRGPPNKRKSIATNNFEKPKTVFSRLSGPVREPVEDSTNYFPPARPRHTVSSQIFVPPVEVPSRSEALEEQKKDPNFRARNKRMFGALLGTLRKFKQDETKLKDRESKKARVEAKLEEAAVKERLALRSQRESLFRARQMKYSEIRTIELRLARLKEHEAWAEAQKPLANFIRTAAEPRIFYLPKVLSKETRKLLAETKTYITDMIAEKSKEVEQQVEEILRQGGADQAMDGAQLPPMEEEDQELEEAYHQAEKSAERPPEPMALDGSPGGGGGGLDEFGRDTSRRERETATPAPPPALETDTPTTETVTGGGRSTSPPVTRDGKRKKAAAASSKKKSSRAAKIKSEDEAESRRTRARTDARRGGQPEEAEVKPRLVTKPSSSGDSSSSGGGSSSGGEASDYYYEDSDGYDENKVIKTEREDRAVKQEKRDAGEIGGGGGGEKCGRVAVKSEKSGEKTKESRADKSEEHSAPGGGRKARSSPVRRNEENGARSAVVVGEEAPREDASGNTGGETVAVAADSVAAYPSNTDPMDLNSISLPGE